MSISRSSNSRRRSVTITKANFYLITSMKVVEEGARVEGDNGTNGGVG
jgi:hypothetical protein